MQQEDRLQDPPRNGLGGAALVLGVVAFVFAFVPVVGEFVAAPAALLAIVLGVLGFRRVERGVATNTGEAVAGGVLGFLAGIVLFLVVAATVGSGA